MAFTYDPTTDIGRVRRTIPDKIEAEAIYTDAEIQSYLDDFDGNWRRAAAQALDDLSGDEALVQKVQETRGLKTNGAELLKALHLRIDKLRQQADEAEADAGGGFVSQPIVRTDFQRRGVDYAEGVE